MLPRIFDLFVQELQAFARSQVGLVWSRDRPLLVELHGGTVWASSRRKRAGSAFTIRLPDDNRPIMLMTPLQKE